MKMSKIVKISLLCGFVATLLGSFLPWQREGDFVSYLTYGIRIFPVVEDNGGILIALLSLSVLMLILQPLKLIEKPLAWSIVSSLALVLVSTFHVIKLLIDRENAIGVIGAPTIEAGLVLVFIGSILLLFASLSHYINQRNIHFPARENSS